VNKLSWPVNFSGLSARADEHQIRDRDHLWNLFERTARQLVFALDVDCKLSINGGAAVNINHANTLTRSSAEFAKEYNTTFADDSLRSTYDDEEASRVDAIVDENGITHSRGVVCVDHHHGNGKVHIGGLTVFRTADSVIKGILAYTPGTVSRTVGRRVASPDDLHGWGSKQLALITAADISADLKLAGIMNLVNINIDVTACALLTADSIITPVIDIIRSLPSQAAIFVSIQRPHGHWPPSLSNYSAHFWKFDDLKGQRHNTRVGTLLFGSGDNYNRIVGPFDAPTNANSGYAALIKELRDAGYSLKITDPTQVPLGSYFGPNGGHGRLLDRELVEGAIIKDYGIEIFCER